MINVAFARISVAEPGRGAAGLFTAAGETSGITGMAFAAAGALASTIGFGTMGNSDGAGEA